MAVLDRRAASEHIAPQDDGPRRRRRTEPLVPSSAAPGAASAPGQEPSRRGYPVGVERTIASFHPDEDGEWIAVLSCGHRQHVRHRPPFQVRPWVVHAEGRASRIGAALDCPRCDRCEPPDDVTPAGARVAVGAPDVAGTAPATTPSTGGGTDEGGDPACWAGVVCTECGAVLPVDGHRPDCPVGDRPG